MPTPAVTAESIRSMLAANAGTYPEAMGFVPVDIDDERAVGRLLVEQHHLHPGQLVHGGVWVGFADTVAAWQTFRHLPEGHNFTTIEMKLNAFGAARLGDELRAEARHLHLGRASHVVEVAVTRAEKRMANLIVTQFVLAAEE